MADLAIITAITDGYDTLKPVLPQTGVDVEWVCVTDGEPLSDADAAAGWTMICEPRHGRPANREAKRPKLRPWEYTTAPASIWVDASFRVVSPRFAVEALALADPIAQFTHPWRGCLYEEAAASVLLPKYAGEPLGEQTAHYRAHGHPEQWGLWAAGVIARWHTAPVRKLGDVWAREVGAWSVQDQVSQPYALRTVGLRPTLLPGTHFANPWLNYEGSGRH
ncbi:glycosyltransferase domain-containing protein [Streptomyces sp. NPDC057236]|uniref:glycosyltransferase domain-containing protein n=1 Tax=Streptomyces sp. NPDC057236 TaxID=3346059 RepID=UPI00363A4277